MKKNKKMELVDWFYTTNACFANAVDMHVDKLNSKLGEKFRIDPKVFLLTQEIPDYCIETLVNYEKIKTIDDGKK